MPLMRYLGLSAVLGYLGAGVLLGPNGLGSFIAQLPALYWFTVVDPENVKGIADLGVVFLLFLIGLELPFGRLLAMRRLVSCASRGLPLAFPARGYHRSRTLASVGNRAVGRFIPPPRRS